VVPSRREPSTRMGVVWSTAAGHPGERVWCHRVLMWWFHIRVFIKWSHIRVLSELTVRAQ
jgi:hypothetical protein